MECVHKFYLTVVFLKMDNNFLTLLTGRILEGVSLYGKNAQNRENLNLFCVNLGGGGIENGFGSVL